MLLMGLRLTEGIDPARYEKLSGRKFDASRLAALAAGGFVEWHGDRLRATRKGRLVLNTLIAELAAA